MTGEATGHVIVTGGASGIGAGVVQWLTAAGTRVSVLDRSGPEAAPWWHRLPGGVRGGWAVADVADPDALIDAVDGLAAGGVTGLVSCAGISVKESFLDSSPRTWSETLDVNVRGAALACHRVAHAMAGRGGGGSIVLIASTVGVGHVAGLGAHYHASKGAIIALTRALAGELGPHGIRVNAVAPGLVRTPLTEFMRRTQGEDVLTARVPLRAMADPADVADAVAFLLSADASMVSGHVLPVDAGQLSVAGQPIGGFADLVTAPSRRRGGRATASTIQHQ
jgi:NAD(P)-dependent dehydrogenase (short-subunit alcohol dehydrogenase family)